MATEPERAATLCAEPEARAFRCPECGHEEATAEGLGTHLERHREVLPVQTSARGRILTFPCPKGCGRNFRPGNAAGRTPSAEIRLHIESCAGLPPLPAAPPAEHRKEEAVAKKFVCEKCPGEKFDSPQGLGAHRRREHPGTAKPRRGGRRAATAGEGAGETEREPLVVPDTNGEARPIKDRILDQLELEEDRLAKELGHCKALIAAVRETPGGGSA
jgi:predicted RNA-binding Zn-ribbon protein involved in translation (DUF1610 family)